MQTRDVVETVAERLADADYVADVVAREPSGVDGVLWDGHSLAAGYSGTAVALFELGRQLNRKDLTDCGFRHVRRAAAAYNEAPGPLGFLTGASGLLAAITAASAEDRRFAPSAHRLHQQIIDEVLDVRWDFNATVRMLPPQYDLISGLAGLLISMATSSLRDSQSQVAIDHVAHFLSWAYVSGGNRAFFQEPGFYHAGAANENLYPHGLTDAGMAHGLAGVLHALSLVQLMTPTTLHLKDPIARLLAAIFKDNGAVTALVPTGKDELRAVGATAAGWCRGRLGIGVAVSWGALATSDATLFAEAKRLVEAEPDPSATPQANCLCHGLAGLLLAAAPGNGRNELEGRLVSAFDPSLPFGYAEPGAFSAINDPTLLSGAAGIAIALNTARHEPASLPKWLRGTFLPPDEKDLSQGEKDFS